jgi:drug/metabolite transporter (DMT)-like permease
MKDEKGVLFALITAFISGVSVYVNGFAVKGLDPFLFATLKNASVSVLILSSVLLSRELSELKKLSKRNWVQLVTIGLVGGSIPFLLFFWGLSMTSGVVGSFLYRFLFIFSAVLAVMFLKEKSSLKIFLGAGIAIVGNALLLGGVTITLGVGEILVLAATILWACENIISKKALEEIEPRIVAFGRMFFGSLIMLAFLAYTNRVMMIQELSLVQLGWVLITTAFLYFFVHFWYKGLKYASLTNAAAALTLGSPVTTFMNLIFLGKAPTYFEATGMLLLVAGISIMVGGSTLLRAMKLIKKYTGVVWKI